MHDGLTGLQVSQMHTDDGSPCALWAVVDYGSPKYSTAPFPILVLTRTELVNLANRILEAVNNSPEGGAT